jgi:hypothetical protein
MSNSLRTYECDGNFRYLREQGVSRGHFPLIDRIVQKVRDMYASRMSDAASLGVNEQGTVTA